MKPIVFTFLGCFLHFYNFSFAQTSEYRFQRYGVQEGLSQGTIREMLQDEKGFWWFATADGLNRYDGYDFTTYHHHQEDPKTIISGDIWDLYADSEGDIWTLTAGGCSKYNHIKDNFDTYAYGSFKATKVFWESNQRHIWMHDLLGNIQVVARESGVLLKKFPKTNATEIIVSVNVKEFLYQFSEYEIDVFNTKTEKWTTIEKPTALGKISTAIALDKNFLLGMESGDFLFCNEDFSSIETYKISNTPINQIIVFEKNYLFATNNGLFIFNPTTKTTINLQHNSNDSKSLSINLVTCIATGNNNSFWVGTNTGGLNKLIPQSNKFKVIRSSDYYLIKSIYKYQNNNALYCGIYDKGLDVYDLSKPTAPPTTIKTDTDIFKIEPWDDKHLLLFYLTGVQLYNIEKQTILEVASQISQLESQPNLSAAFKLASNNFLIGLNQKIYQLKNLQSVELFSTTLFNSEITCFWGTDENKVFVGTSAGLYILNNKTSKKIIIPNVYVKHITKSADNSFWIATTTGLYQYKEGSQPKLYNNDNYGLANDFIYGVVEGAGNSLWASHNRGLSRLNLGKSVFKNFNLSDNLQSPEFNTGAFFRSEDGLIVFGGVGGINYFDANEFFDNPIAPIPIISNIRVNDYDFPSDTVIWYKKSLILPYDQNTLSFEFTGLQFANAAYNQYYYKMQGIDKDWIFSGGRRFARYPNLPPGKYTFQVRAANDDGNESNQIARIAIEIIAPIYMRWWFLFLVGLLGIIGIIGVIYFWQRRKYRKRMQALEILTRVKNERERISRDLHDNVGAQITYLISSMDWAVKQLPENSDTLTERFATLRSNAQNMMSSIRDTIWALNKDAITVQDFADRLKQYVIYQIRDVENLELSYFENIEIEHILPSNTVLNLFRIGQEAVQNIIKHSGAHIITVSVICQDEKTLLLAIGDDGKGFDATSVNYDSFGLDNMNYRAIEIGGILNIRTAPKKGVTIELRVQLDD